MIKPFAFSLSLVFGFTSLSLAAYPGGASGLEAPSILVKTQAAEIKDVAADPVPAQTQASSNETSPAIVDGAKIESDSDQSVPVEGMPVDEAVVQSAPVAASETSPVYRVARPSRRQNNGVFSELMELERRKNAWLKKNFLGR